MLGLARLARERGDDETGIGFPLRGLGLGHDPAPAAPGRARHPHEALEAALGLAGAPALRHRTLELALDLGHQPLVARQPEHEVDAVGLAPGHQVIACEACVGTQHNARARTTRADASDEARATSSSAPSAASMLARRSLATSRWRPQNTYRG